MITTEDIKEYLKIHHHHIEQFCKLAENHSNICSKIEAFNYDLIKKDLSGDKCESADALYLKKHIYFVEFKTGFATEKTDANIRTHKENLKLKIRLKAYESLALFEKILLPEIGDGLLNEKVQKQYIAVIDSEAIPMRAYADVLKEKSGRKDTFRYEIFKNSLLIYGKEMKNGKKLFYDRVDVWYDFEFDGKAEKLA